MPHHRRVTAVVSLHHFSFYHLLYSKNKGSSFTVLSIFKNLCSHLWFELRPSLVLLYDLSCDLVCSVVKAAEHSPQPQLSHQAAGERRPSCSSLPKYWEAKAVKANLFICSWWWSTTLLVLLVKLQLEGRTFVLLSVFYLTFFAVCVSKKKTFSVKKQWERRNGLKSLIKPFIYW